VLRQPIRALILSILIGVAAFAFVARATEFVVVKDEITRIEAFYRAVGFLSPIRVNNFTTDHDVTRALDVIEANRHVAISDARTFTQGVFVDMYNVASQPAGRAFFNPVLHGVDIPMMDHFFIGSIRTTPRLIPFSYPPELVVNIDLQELVRGDPSTLRVGEREFTNEQGQTVTLFSRQNMHLIITEEERELFEQGLWNPFNGLDVGEYAFFRATPRYVAPTYAGDYVGWFGFNWFLRPLDGVDGLQYAWVERPDGGELYRPVPREGERSDPENFVFYINAYDEAAIADLLIAWEKDFALMDENLSIVTVIGTQDLSAVPRFMDTRITRLVDTVISPAGRWLTYEDYLSGNPVAVIPASLAARRFLRIGDYLTITLRDTSRPAWIDTPSESTWARGIENWWNASPEGWWGFLESTQDDWQGRQTHEITVEIVGIYWFFPLYFHNFITAEIFIPASVIPEGFGWEESPQLSGMYSFVLNSPRVEDAFLRETYSALFDLGFRAVFLQSGFEYLAAATDPIRLSITVNLIVFGMAAALILTFVILLYLRNWRKSVAIAQALGVTRRNVLRQLFVPVIALWVPFIIVGGLFAWFFAIGQAEETLAVIADYETAVMPGIYMLAIMCGLLIAFVMTGLWLGGNSVVRRPVLTQLQGGTQRRQKVAYIESGVLPEGFDPTSFEIPDMPTNKRFGAGMRASLRHSMRHVFRTPVKTALALLLAIIFVFSLGWLNHMVYSTEAEIERLWETTIIEAEIFWDREVPDFGRLVGFDNFIWPAIITPAAWEAIEFSGFFGEAYLESFFWGWFNETAFIGVSHLDGLIYENTRTPAEEQLGIVCDDMEIEFLYDFSQEDFVYIPGEPVPMIIRRDMYEAYIELDDYSDEMYEYSDDYYTDNSYADDESYAYYEYDYEMDDVFSGYGDVEFVTIGVFDGGLARSIGRFDNHPIYIYPIEFHQAFFYRWWPLYGWGGWGLETYYPPFLTARFTINPARNQEIYRLPELLETALYDNNLDVFGRFPLQLHIDDDVIYNVIIPMEQSLSLLRVLYPIAIGVAFVLALGLSLLTMLQSAKNAAIMRVLGKPKMISQIMLNVEQLMVYVVGIALGLFALLITGTFLGVTPLFLAGIYFGGAVIGSVIGAFVISMRAPLSLLQVRE